MYNTIKNVIQKKGYSLTDILDKIEKRCLEGFINEEEREELKEYARENADVQHEVDLLKKVIELETRVKALEENKMNGEVGEESPAELYPPFVAGRWYYNGDRCSEGEKNYICIAPDGQVCTWSPSQYPAYWQLVTEAE